MNRMKTPLHGAVILALVAFCTAAAFTCRPIGPGVSERDVCKSGDYFSPSRTSNRNYACAFALDAINSPMEGESAQDRRTREDTALVYCLYAQIYLNECDSRSEYPIY